MPVLGANSYGGCVALVPKLLVCAGCVRGEKEVQIVLTKWNVAPDVCQFLGVFGYTMLLVRKVMVR